MFIYWHISEKTDPGSMFFERLCVCNQHGWRQMLWGYFDDALQCFVKVTPKQNIFGSFTRLEFAHSP